MVKPKVLIVRAVGYAGATWVSLVTGSHPGILCLGPADRIWKLAKQDASSACMLHNAQCPFWPPFVRTYDRSQNFILELSKYAPQKVFVLYNPSKEMTEAVLQDPGLDIICLQVVRDGRANAFSALRHLPHRFSEFKEVTRYWYVPAVINLEKLMKPYSGISLTVKYEDMIFQPDQSIKKIGEFLGVRYPPNVFRYWEHEHHPVGGNSGALDLLRRLKGFDGFQHRRSDFYDRAYAQMLADQDLPVIDQSWQDELTREDRMFFDYFAGSLNAKYGYERDLFTEMERSAFLERFGLRPDFDPYAPKALQRPAAEQQSIQEPAVAAAAGDTLWNSIKQRIKKWTP